MPIPDLAQPSTFTGGVPHDVFDELRRLAAGFETTHTLISQSMRMTPEDPQVRDRTNRAMESLGPGTVVDEFLRLVTPAMNMARTATCDVEPGGQQVREGDLVGVHQPADVLARHPGTGALTYSARREPRYARDYLRSARR